MIKASKKNKVKSKKDSFIQPYIHTGVSMFVWLYECMKFLKLKFTILSISVLLCVACDNNPPIPEEKFIRVYVDLLIIQDTTNVQDKSLDSLKTIVFKKNGITTEEYFSALGYYKSYPEKWEEIFDKAIAYSEKLRDESSKKP